MYTQQNKGHYLQNGENKVEMGEASGSVQREKMAYGHKANGIGAQHRHKEATMTDLARSGDDC